MISLPCPRFAGRILVETGRTGLWLWEKDRSGFDAGANPNRAWTDAGSAPMNVGLALFPAVFGENRDVTDRSLAPRGRGLARIDVAGGSVDCRFDLDRPLHGL
jgi:hypothetical protein